MDQMRQDHALSGRTPDDSCTPRMPIPPTKPATFTPSLPYDQVSPGPPGQPVFRTVPEPAHAFRF